MFETYVVEHTFCFFGGGEGKQKEFFSWMLNMTNWYVSDGALWKLES